MARGTQSPDTRWWMYVQEVTPNEAQQNEIAARAGIDKTHITRWKQGFEPTVQFVVKFARAYNRNVLEALVAADMITEGEAQLREVRVGQTVLTDDELIDELRQRLQR